MYALRCAPVVQLVNYLSGGVRLRVALCRLLLQKPDILLLDEPTNHLDAESIDWLEQHLQQYEGTVIAVTHDRYFLDHVAGWILELDRGEGIPWKGNYSSWLEQKTKRMEMEEKTASKRRKTLERELEWVRMAPKARQAKGKARLNSYDKLLNEDVKEKEEKLEIFIPNGPRLGNKVIEAKHVAKAYGDKLLFDDLNFMLPPNGIVGVIGPNGAGKSTTILMMLGLTEPTSGIVEICGINSTTHPIEVKRRIGYLPEDVGFYDDMTGPENLIYTARLNGIPDKEAKTKAMELMKRVGLEEQLTKKTGKYSRGMRQRLGLADVLIKNPEIIILDEPTSGIDPAGVQEFIELIRWLSKEEGLTVLFSSHHLDQVQKVCDRVGLFSNGQLLALIDMAELKDKKQELSDIYNHYFEEGGERHE